MKLCIQCKKPVKTYKEMAEHFIDEANSHSLGMVKWAEGYLRRSIKKVSQQKVAEAEKQAEPICSLCHKPIGKQDIEHCCC